MFFGFWYVIYFNRFLKSVDRLLVITIIIRYGNRFQYSSPNPPQKWTGFATVITPELCVDTGFGGNVLSALDLRGSLPGF